MTKIIIQQEFLRKLPEFQNVKVINGIEDEVREGETIDQARARIKAKVEQWMQEDIREIDEDLKNG